MWGHELVRVRVQKAETATLALEVEDKAGEVHGLKQPVADLEARLGKEGLASTAM